MDNAVPRKMIGELLIEAGLLTEEELFNALDAQRLNSEKKRLGEVILDLGYLDSATLEDFLRTHNYYEPFSDVQQHIGRQRSHDIHGSSPAGLDIKELLELMVQQGASDLHIRAGLPPQLRIHGNLIRTEYPVLAPEQVRALAYTILTREEIQEFEQHKELDLSFGVKGLSRFRVNMYQQRGTLGMTIRVIPFRIPRADELGLPPVAKELVESPHGLILVTGSAGSGKSTTLAALIEYLNESKNLHVVTIEDPIEYTFKHKRCAIDQRELGRDTHSFSEALRRVFRQDPDVVMIGEMRDLETIKTALTLSETGHLILGTLHTIDSIHAISRIIDVFPEYQKEQIRMQLSMVLVAVICQQLVPRMDGAGRILATEILRGIPSVQNLIRENNLPQIYSVLQTNKRLGMQTMCQGLGDLYKENIISRSEFLRRSPNRDEAMNIIDKKEALEKRNNPNL